MGGLKSPRVVAAILATVITLPLVESLYQVPIQVSDSLEPIVKRNREAHRLRFSTDVAASVAHAEVQIIAAVSYTHLTLPTIYSV